MDDKVAFSTLFFLVKNVLLAISVFLSKKSGLINLKEFAPTHWDDYFFYFRDYLHV